MASTVWVKKAALAEVQIHDEPLPQLGDGEVRLRIESFSVTANNVTYAVIGDMFGYWNFFPAHGDYGVVPIWGHAVVEQRIRLTSKNNVEFVRASGLYDHVLEVIIRP